MQTLDFGNIRSAISISNWNLLPFENDLISQNQKVNEPFESDTLTTDRQREREKIDIHTNLHFNTKTK